MVLRQINMIIVGGFLLSVVSLVHAMENIGKQQKIDLAKWGISATKETLPSQYSVRSGALAWISDWFGQARYMLSSHYKNLKVSTTSPKPIKQDLPFRLIKGLIGYNRITQDNLKINNSGAFAEIKSWLFEWKKFPKEAKNVSFEPYKPTLPSVSKLIEPQEQSTAASDSVNFSLIAFFQAVQDRKCLQVQEMLKIKRLQSSVNAKDSLGRTPLYYAFENNDNQTIQVLVVGGADFNQDYKGNQTFFQTACTSGRHSALGMGIYDGITNNPRIEKEYKISLLKELCGESMSASGDFQFI